MDSQAAAFWKPHRVAPSEESIGNLNESGRSKGVSMVMLIDFDWDRLGMELGMELQLELAPSNCAGNRPDSWSWSWFLQGLPVVRSCSCSCRACTLDLGSWINGAACSARESR